MLWLQESHKRGDMRKIVCIVFVLFAFFSCKKDESADELIVYAYKSFTGEWGAGAKVARLFKEKTGSSIKFITCKDAQDVLSKAMLERGEGDVVLGIDNYMLEKAKRSGVLTPYKPMCASSIKADFIMSDDWLITPFDYGYFTFMWNKEKDEEPPTSIQEFLEDKYKQKIVIMNPMTSSPGLGALLWLYAVYGEEGYIEAWKKMTGNALSMPTSWSQGYSLFTTGEVDFALSYTTSLAAHILYDNTEKFWPLILDEGHLIQLEGVALLKDAAHKKLGEEFIDFMLSDEVQSILCETQFMFPIMDSVELPMSFKKIPSPKKILKVSDVDIDKIVSDAMNVLE